MEDGNLEADKDTFNMATASQTLSSDPTSLVDLKAEVFRKKQEALYNKVHGRSTASSASETRKKNNIWSKSNIGVLKRSTEAAEEARKERLRVQAALEEKAAVYDKLKSGKYSDKDEVFLVNFNRGRAEESDEEEEDPIPPAKHEGEEWVEYVDALGRTRMCMKSELDLMKQRDLQTFGEAGTSKTEAELSMLSEDMRRELLRQKWEQEEEENLKKTQLHYRDVLFDEARTHGVSFYNFSRNESDRRSQLDNLESIHTETVEARAKKETAKAKREAALAERLRKVRNKKRLKMGLPILPEDDEPIKLAEETEVASREASIEDSVMEGLKSLRKAEEEKMRKSIVREWDIGKDGVNAQKPTDQEEFKEKLKINMERKVLSQQEWVDQKRKERPNEFAPPSAYAKKPKTSLTKNYGNVPPPSLYAKSATTKASRNHSTHVPPLQAFACESPTLPKAFNPCVPPPPRSFEGHKGQEEFDPDEPLPPGYVPPQGNQEVEVEQGCMTKPDAHRPCSPVHDSGQISKPIVNEVVSKEQRLRLHQQFVHPEPLEERFDESATRRTRAEIAPPASMDYYSSDKRPRERPKGFRSHEQMAEAFLSGLKNNMPGMATSESESDDE